MTILTTNFEERWLARSAKRAFDIVFSAIALMTLSPWLIVITVAARFSTGGSAVLGVKRLGKGGVPFLMLKFRTMRVNSISRPVSSNNIESDPRVTRVGKFLQKTSLDQLPQFLNVLKGDMSLVGPRPVVVLAAAHYSELEQRRFLVRPGITGLWQVERGIKSDTSQMLALDLQYIENWSFWLDLKIIWASAVRGLKGSGSY